MQKAGDIVEQCSGILRSRESTHGSKVPNMDNIAKMWNAWLDIRRAGPLTGADVAQMMVLMKQARVASGDATEPDHYIDAANYAAIAFECETFYSAIPQSTE